MSSGYVMNSEAAECCPNPLPPLETLTCAYFVISLAWCAHLHTINLTCGSVC